ncbi:site-specific recombinase XerC [Streptomyces phaeochromogenes]|nr:site-specific recombinase XerC [Streptomyces phaeochromogenes]
MAASVVPHGQEVLFWIRRDWTPVITRVRSGETLPEISGRVGMLVEEFDSLRRQRRRPGSGREAQRALALLLRFLGADAPVWEHDVHDLARAGTGLHARAVCEFLKGRDLLAQAPELHEDPDRVWIEAVLGGLPTQLAAEVATWVRVLRGEGRWPHPARSFRCIRRYLAALRPILATWQEAGIASLREVTDEDVVQAVQPGQSRNRKPDSQLSPLRSLFRALKQERTIFRDPARALTGHGHKGLPRSVPSDVLPAMFEEVTSAFGRLIMALVAVHALTGESIRELQLADLDLAHGRLTVRRGLRRRSIQLEPFTHQLAADWLAERHLRWPASTNPHLLTTGRTAFAAAAPPVHVTTILRIFPQGVNLDMLRQDRILDEAHASTDPLHLMRLFGISEVTAMRYITAAHPERTARLPR